MAEAQTTPARPWTPTETPGDKSYTSPVVYHGDHQVKRDEENSDESSSDEQDMRSNLGGALVVHDQVTRPGPLRFKSSQALREDAAAAAAASAPEVQLYQAYQSQQAGTVKDGTPLSLRPKSSLQALNVDRGDHLPTNNPYRMSQALRTTSKEEMPMLRSQRSSEVLGAKEHDDSRLPLNNPYRLSQGTRSESTEGLLLKPRQTSRPLKTDGADPSSVISSQRLQAPVINTDGDLPSITGMSTQQIKILLINPNSTKSMTERCLESIAGSLPAHVTVYGFTAPRPAPTAIESQTDAIMSTAACIKAILPMAAKYDAFLVACFSHHPLVAALREQVMQPVIGIMEASLYAARMCGSKFGIVTTSVRSMLLHDASVKNVYGLGPFSVGTESSRLGVLELETRPEPEVQERLAAAARRLQGRGADCICLGCAGMTDLQKACQDAVGMHDGVAMVIDGVAIGVHFLVGLVRESLGTAKGTAHKSFSGHKAVNSNS